MGTTTSRRGRGWSRREAFGALALGALLLAACGRGAGALVASSESMTTTTAAASGTAAAVERTEVTEGQEPGSTLPWPVERRVRVIRDGRVDLRIEPGTFSAKAAELRTIAADLGGYLAEGETHLEEVGDRTFTVGAFTLRVPEDRFEDALARAERMGERIDLSVTSQDVGEEYVDLESRLGHWRRQEAFYTRLMDEATTVQDLVEIQGRMEQVLRNIDEVEGRLRYLEGRTDFSTLTVGLTEVPSGGDGDTGAVGPPSVLHRALERAGGVLLESIGFLLVAAAFLLPPGVLVGVGIVGFRAVRAVRRRRREEGTPAVEAAGPPE